MSATSPQRPKGSRGSEIGRGALRVFGLTLTLLLYILVAANMALYAYYGVKDAYFSIPRSLERHSSESLQHVYPGMSEKEIGTLLRETWSRPFVYEPFTQFKESPYTGRFVNVSPDGYRLGKQQGPWPTDPQAVTIFLLGGSTTFGYGLPDDETVSSLLQSMLTQRLGKAVRCYNFGRGHYYSSQELVLFERLLAAGARPDLVIFLDGINDYSHSSDVPQFTRQLAGYMSSPRAISLPMSRFFGSLAKGSRGQGQGAAASSEALSDLQYRDADLIERVTARYLANKRIIEATATAFEVEVLFVWQPTPFYKYDLDHYVFSDAIPSKHLHSRWGYKHMRGIAEGDSLGMNFLWLADIQQSVAKSLYVDIIHYSAELTSLVADQIADEIVSLGVLSVSHENSETSKGVRTRE